ncbi:hypothetical protein SAMN04488112_13012 [Melghirimyces thermohalophilus]|uniref:Uncharacterized protein n=1 Tax=Melghirimyces thermohalophilus TaxID=1236220 RepID=A0A1G6RQC3_9BACL|nr:hypothetical protein SAMN04488112_13012 [Melghirimyces thermohalophilus]
MDPDSGEATPFSLNVHPGFMWVSPSVGMIEGPKGEANMKLIGEILAILLVVPIWGLKVVVSLQGLIRFFKDSM